MNVNEIVKAMDGRRVRSINDGSLRDSVRMKLEWLAKTTNYPMTRTDALRIADHVIRAASGTDLFEKEVELAMDAGAAGEFGDRRLIPTVVSMWVSAYSVCGDRQAAADRIKLSNKIARKQADSVVNDELRRDWEENGLRRAWEDFAEAKRDGADWKPLPGRAYAVYNQLSARGLMPRLNSDTLALARTEAIAAVRRSPRSIRDYSRASEDEVLASPSYDIQFKAAIVRLYFEELWNAGRSLDWEISEELPL